MSANKSILTISNDVSRSANSKPQIAYDLIKDAIIKNELKPETLLVERQLCDYLGISRTPIREALRKLASEGLVDFIPEKGMFVTPIRFEDMIEIYELREALEGMAIKLCVLRKTDDLIKQMEECISIQEIAYRRGQSSLCVEKDLEFHNLFIKGAKNNRLENLLKTVRDQNYRMALFTTTDHNRLEMSIEQHKKVLEAVKCGDEGKAEALVKEHIVNVKEYHVKKQYSAMI